jgi:hypothetical protein
LATGQSKTVDSIEDFAGGVYQKRPKSEDVSGQNGLWTPPRLVSTSILCDSFAVLSKKGQNVDMWTVFSLIITSVSVHRCGGQPRTFRQSYSRPCQHPPRHIGGFPFDVHGWVGHSSGTPREPKKCEVVLAIDRMCCDKLMVS